MTEVVDLNGQGEGGMWQTVNDRSRRALCARLADDRKPGPWAPTRRSIWTSRSPTAPSSTRRNVAAPNTESNANVIASQTDWISDPTWNGAVVALFQQFSITFIAKSNQTTITFNSQQSDNDAYDVPYGGGFFNCGPEITAIQMNYPAINLTS